MSWDKGLWGEEGCGYGEKYEDDGSKVSILRVEEYNERYGKWWCIWEYDMFSEGVDW